MSNCCRDLRWEKSPELKITHLNFMLFRLQMDRNTDDSLDREIRRDSPPVESNSKRCFMFLNFISQFLDTSTVMMLINHSLISHRRLVKLEIEQLVMSHHWNQHPTLAVRLVRNLMTNQKAALRRHAGFCECVCVCDTE